MNIRLGGGEYDGGEMATWEARMRFLDAVADVRPEVLESLRDDVLPLYDSWDLLGPNDVHGDLRDALEKWTERFNLSFNWVAETALATLRAWFVVYPEALDEIAGEWQHIAEGYWMLTSNDERRIIFKHAGWDPAGETRKAFEDRVTADFEKHIRSYIDRMAGLIEERGMIKAPKVRSLEQFKLLALWQVGDYETFGEIARDTYRTRQAATMAIQRAAGLCGIPVPRGEPGKPGAAGKPPQK